MGNNINTAFATAFLMNPMGLRDAFFIGLKEHLDINDDDLLQLQTNKIFTGDKVAVQSKNVSGVNTIKFAELANGQTRFPQDEHMLVMGFRVLSGVNAVLEETDWEGGVTDPNLLNAEMSLQVSTDQNFVNFPVNTFTQALEQNDSGWYYVKSPFYWTAQTKAVLQIDFPVPVATADTNLQIQLWGPGLI